LKRTIFIAIALLTVAPAVRAEDMTQFQVGLNGGYRVGGSLEDEVTGDDRDLDEASSFAVSLELRYRKGDDRFYQLWYSRQSSSVNDGVENHGVDVEYLHLGGTLPFGGWEHAQPYFAAGLGATRFSSSAPERTTSRDSPARWLSASSSARQECGDPSRRSRLRDIRRHEHLVLLPVQQRRRCLPHRPRAARRSSRPRRSRGS
jgi:hypothetical protein